MPSTPISLAPVPATLKPIAHYLKVAAEHETRDPVIAYWCRLSALQNGMTLDRKSTEAMAVLVPLMDWLEKEKKVLAGDEAVTSDVVASAHVENYAVKLFAWADKEDRAGKFGKNVVKSFYTAGILYDVLQVFGELSPENSHARKYSKWKAAYIHNCLKNGETPIAGPVSMPGGESGGEDPSVAAPSAGPSGWTMPQIPPSDPEPDQKPPVPAPRANPAPSVPPAAVPVIPPVSVPQLASGEGVASLTPELMSKAQKYCKYAGSALDYEDGATAIVNLTKALNLLKTGREE